MSYLSGRALACACLILLGGIPLDSQGEEPASAQSSQDLLNDALDLLAAPARYRLEYRTTKVGAKTVHSEELRKLLREQSDQSGTYYKLFALVEHIRVQESVSDPNKRMSESGVYIGATTNYSIFQDENLFLQELLDDPQAMPIVLRGPDFTLQYHRSNNLLRVTESSEPLDLRTMESIVSPLPMTTIAREHWSSSAPSVSKVDGELRFALQDPGIVLSVKCTQTAPHLPVAAWIRAPDGDEMILGVFLSYQDQAGVVVPGVVLSVRETPHQIRIDEYAFKDFSRPTASDSVKLRVPADVRIRSTLGGKTQAYPSLESIPAEWLSLITTAN